MGRLVVWHNIDGLVEFWRYVEYVNQLTVNFNDKNLISAESLRGAKIPRPDKQSLSTTSSW